MAKIITVEGIGETYAKKLQDAGIETTDLLLEKGATPAGRNELADATGISKTLILEWVNHCDLYRISGVGEEYADLLEASGVDTVPELAQRNAGNLYQKMVEVNEQKNLVRQIPAESKVEEWVGQAKNLPRKIEY
jgi:predicted flap endonuclease-1-like 5' DNA nuclease